MRVVTADEMRESDRKAISDCGIPGVVLMENAGYAVTAAVCSACSGVKGKRAAVFCGAGNNGGDGYVVARRLLLLGAKPTVFMLASENQLKGDALQHYRALKSSVGADIRPFESSVTDDRAELFDVVVDALLGTGLKDAPRATYAEAIKYINRLGRFAPVIAVDIPSGVESDSGAVPGDAVQATITVTFAYPKLGMYLFPGAARIGQLMIDDIGFGWDQINTRSNSQCRLIEVSDIGSFFSSRPSNSNKGDFGHVGIIAGSRGMAGAPAMVARAAQRIGAGLVTVLTPASVQQAVAVKLDEQMTLPLTEDEGGISPTAFDSIAAIVERFSVLCVGPGLTTYSGAVEVIDRILTELNSPVVLDADGLNALALKPDLIERRRSYTQAALILTPHPGEAARLLGTSIETVESNRIESVRALASRYSAVVLLKGRYTVVSDPSGSVWINTTGNPGMATGGMGDTLTGIIGGLLAQASGMRRHDANYCVSIGDARLAACAGAYVHGAAGDAAAIHTGEISLTAGDLIKNLPDAIRTLQCGSA